jgi:lipopolysaccharide biosynthesis regulator YciM
MDVLLFLLLPVAAFSGWLTGRKSSSRKAAPAFFTGLNYSISQQPDKTLDALVQMPAIDHDTIETHLTLGVIFRRRGEIERAIRLHQGLIQRPYLATHYKSAALLELSRDYIAAGVLDRAETILLELIANNEQLIPSMQHLLELYQQGKEWVAAINIAYKLQEINNTDLSSQIAHFYCELAEQASKTQQFKQAKCCIKRALKAKYDCPRANIMHANIEHALGNFRKALRLYKKIAIKYPDYIPDQNHKYSYRCNNCGFSISKLQWHCPRCRQWGMFKPLQSSVVATLI